MNCCFYISSHTIISTWQNNIAFCHNIESFNVGAIHHFYVFTYHIQNLGEKILDFPQLWGCQFLVRIHYFTSSPQYQIQYLGKKISDLLLLWGSIHQNHVQHYRKHCHSHLRHSKLRPNYPLPKIPKNCPRHDIKSGKTPRSGKAREGQKSGCFPASKGTSGQRPHGSSVAKL